MVEDCVIGSEDAVGEPVLAHEQPDVLDRVELRAFGRQRDDGDVGQHDEVMRQMPTGLIHQQHGVRTRCDGGGDLGQMQAHRGGVASRQHECRAPALAGADGAENVGRGGALILRCRRPRTMSGPPAGDLVLLTNPGFDGEPDFYSAGLDAFLECDIA